MIFYLCFSCFSSTFYNFRCCQFFIVTCECERRKISRKINKTFCHALKTKNYFLLHCLRRQRKPSLFHALSLENLRNLFSIFCILLFTSFIFCQKKTSLTFHHTPKCTQKIYFVLPLRYFFLLLFFLLSSFSMS